MTCFRLASSCASRSTLFLCLGFRPDFRLHSCRVIPTLALWAYLLFALLFGEVDIPDLVAGLEHCLGSLHERWLSEGHVSDNVNRCICADVIS